MITSISEHNHVHLFRYERLISLKSFQANLRPGNLRHLVADFRLSVGNCLKTTPIKHPHLSVVWFLKIIFCTASAARGAHSTAFFQLVKQFKHLISFAHSTDSALNTHHAESIFTPLRRTKPPVQRSRAFYSYHRFCQAPDQTLIPLDPDKPLNKPAALQQEARILRIDE